jgi:transcriptional regulator with XRE-family HTH domain
MRSAKGQGDLQAMIAEELRRRRIGARMSRQMLAARAGLEARRIADYETGEAELEAPTLWRLCRALEIEVDDFFEPISDRARRLNGPKPPNRPSPLRR